MVSGGASTFEYDESSSYEVRRPRVDADTQTTRAQRPAGCEDVSSTRGRVTTPGPASTRSGPAPRAPPAPRPRDGPFRNSIQRAERPRYLRPSAARAPARFRTAPVPTRIQRAGSAVAAARAPALRAGSESGATRAGSRPRPRAPLPGAAPVALPPRPRGRSDAGAPASGTAQRLLILYTLHTHADIRVRLGPQRGQAVKTARH